MVALVDYSGSIGAEQLQRCSSTIKTVLDNFGEHDAMSVYPIDAGAVTRNERLISLDIGQETFTNSADGVTHASDSSRARANAYVKSVEDSLLQLVKAGRSQRRQFTGKTDIIGAIDGISGQIERDSIASGFAPRVNVLFGQHRVMTTNVVVICSDMINESADGDFEKHPPDGKSADSLIAMLRRAGRMPDLTGAAVFIAGRTGRDARQVDAIKSFWVRYFHEAGADLKAYDFDVSRQLSQFLVRSA